MRAAPSPSEETFSAPNEKAFILELVRNGLIILVVSVVCAVIATWLTTRHLPNEVLYPALLKAFLFPWLIVPPCTILMARVSLKYWQRMKDFMRLALTDEMTGLSNRRAFLDTAQNLLNNVDLEIEGLCLFIIDLDYFKRVNDKYGHEAGDAALIQAAHQIQAAAPRYATVARLGGEEFALIMPYHSLTEVSDIAENIRAAIALHPCRFEKALIGLTASIGVGIISEGDTIRMALSRADSALYAAKKDGRNRMVVAA